jgi:rhamnose utilization protein RhaD (predicted bifunctional aldolase and dehydrogenase)
LTHSNKINQLIFASKFLGKKQEYIQGAGGNTSIKLDENIMAIKSSGIKLKNILKKTGISNIKYKDLNYKLNTNKKFFLNNSFENFNLNKIYRASMETGFHSLLGSAVIHTHSVYINTILCSYEGKKIISKLFPTSYWANYYTPGLDITLRIQKIVKNIKNIRVKNVVFFLENHGIIVSSKNFKNAINLHEKINKKIIHEFNLSKYNDFKNYEKQHKINKFFFPDQVIFSQSSNLINTESGLENLRAAKYISDQIKKIKLTPKLLDKKSINSLINLESEKYRQKIV